MYFDDANTGWKPVVVAAARAARTSADASIHDGKLLFTPRTFTHGVCNQGTGTNLYLYGSTAAKRTVLVRAKRFFPYFYVRLPPGTEHKDAEQFVNALQELLLFTSLQPNDESRVGYAAKQAFSRELASPVVLWKIVNGRFVKPIGPGSGYRGSGDSQFVQVYVYCPQLVRIARNLIEAVHTVDSLHEALVRVLTPFSRDDDAKEPPTKKKRTMRSLNEYRSVTQSSASQNDAEENSDDDLVNVWNDPSIDISYANGDDVGDDAEQTNTRSVWTVSEEMRGKYNALHDLERRRGGLRSLLAFPASNGMPDVCEADVDYVLRFCIDVGFQPEQWVQLDVYDSSVDMGYSICDERRKQADGSWSGGDIEVSCDYSALTLASEDWQQKMAPQLCFSVDCEMAPGPKGQFPRAETDSVLQICGVLFDPIVDSACKQFTSYSFVLGTIDQSDGAEYGNVFAFNNEADLLSAFSLFLNALQPDMLTGWNIEQFDLTYLIARAKHLQLVEFASFCRVPGATARVHDRIFQSGAAGTHSYTEVTGTGMWIWDLLQYFKRSPVYNFRSYALGAVSDELLSDQKDDVAYSQINTLQKTAVGRAKLLRYCLKDALLPARLIGARGLLFEQIELSRITGCPLDMICRRGMQIRLVSPIQRHALRMTPRHIICTRTEQERAASAGSSFQGAYVFEPDRGLHTGNVIVEDLASLYPSIEKTINMCWMTFILPEDRDEIMRENGLTMEDINWIDNGVDDPNSLPVFVKSSVLVGLIPSIITEFLAMRKAIKKLMNAAKDAGDSMNQSIYDSRQKAVKIIANSIYGMFGAAVGRGYCPPIAFMTTLYGRFIINTAAAHVKERYTRSNNYPFDAHIVYGDTDSIFVHIGTGLTVHEAAVYGQEMAVSITQCYRELFGDRADNAIVMEFEKIYTTFLLLAKKKYAGDLWAMKNGVMRNAEEIDMNGLETVRRDSCMLVSNGVKHILNLLLRGPQSKTEKLAAIKEYVIGQMIQPVLSGTVNFGLLTQSKQLRKRRRDYDASGSHPPIHVCLADRLEKRLGVDSPDVPRSGDRVPYVVVEPDVPGTTVTDCGENPEYAWRKRFKPNRKHYIDKCIKMPIGRVLEPVLFGNSESLTENKRKAEVKRAIDGFFTGTASTAKTVVVSSKKRARTGLFANSAPKRRRCILCGIPCPADVPDGICAEHSAGEREQHIRKQTDATAELRKVREELWNTCQACVRGIDLKTCEDAPAVLGAVPDLEELDVLTPCKSTDCSVYWKRLQNDRALDLD